jgi:peptidylprolyl isomerase
MFKAIAITIAVLIVVAYFKLSYDNKKAAASNIERGQAFLENNKSTIGVEETASGLQYLLLEGKGSGERPTASSRVTVHYRGELLDGRVFDSSYDRGEPISFGLQQVIEGWTEGLQLMTVGDKYRLFIPAKLAYGNRAAGMIPPGSTLIFDVELIAVD